MVESPRRQKEAVEAWSQAAGPLLQAEIEKAVVQGLTAAFRALVERLPQLLGEIQKQPTASPPPVSPASATMLRIVVEEAAESPTSIEATASASEAEPPEAAHFHFRQAMEARRAGDDARALVHFTHAIRLDPRAKTYLARSQLHWRHGRMDEALADADNALHLDPGLAPAYYLRAAVRLRQGDNKQAIDDLTHFLQLQPDHALAHHARGLAHANEGEYDRAIGDFGRALRLRPKLLAARYQRSLAYRHKGEHRIAVVELTKIVTVRPDFAHAYFNRALARLALEEHERAIEDLDKAIELAPNNHEFRARREQAVTALRQSREDKSDGETKRPESLPRPSPAPRLAEIEHADPTFLPLTCPSCGASARVSWKRLDRLFRCRKCTRVFRVNREGHLTKIDPNPPPSRGYRYLKRGVVSAAALVAILMLAVGLQRWFRPKSTLADLPNDLPARGELWAKGWLNDDRALLRRLTSPTHDRQLHPWLTRHPPPAGKERASVSQPDSAPPEIHLRVRNTKPHEAVVSVRIVSQALQTPREFQLDWVERGDIWYYVPVLKR